MQDRTIVEVPTATWALLEAMAEERGRTVDEAFRAAVGALAAFEELAPGVGGALVEAAAMSLRERLRAERRPEQN